MVLYGNCFGLNVPNDFRKKMIKRHRFLLSFENAHCLDYNTEKYWDALMFGAIPIVLGNKNNKENLVPNSYIDVMNFKHPYFLAKHLRKVNRKIHLLKKYHKWGRTLNVQMDVFEMESCEMLQKITDYISNNKLNDDTVNKISDSSICINPNSLKSEIISLK